MSLRCQFRNALCARVAVVAWLATASALYAGDLKTEYVADILFDRLASLQSWGELGRDTAVKPVGGVGGKLRIKDKSYEHGLGAHADGEIFVPLEGLYKTFEAEVGLQWQDGNDQGSVVFEIFVDNRKVFDSGTMRAKDAAKKVSVSVENAASMRLVVTNAGDGYVCDCANWADARLLSDPDSQAQMASNPVDIAPSASVVISDPNRMFGTRASRTEELPAADVFLDSDLKPGVDGNYVLPAKSDGSSCIGLRWQERRALRCVELHWAESSAVPAADSIQLQQWVSAALTPHWLNTSRWQGQWKPLPAKFEQSNGVGRWEIAAKDMPVGVSRVRWVFPASPKPFALKKIAAFSRSLWTNADLRVELREAQAGQSTPIVVTNGSFLGPDGNQTGRQCIWKADEPLALRVRYSVAAAFNKCDRTVLRFELPGQPISVSVEDVVLNGCVSIPMAGLFVSLDPAPTSLSQCFQQIEGKKTVLEQVRMLPDQTFAQAMAKTHNPIQDGGPMVVSLAHDNRKFVVYRDGVVNFHAGETPDGPYPDLYLLNVSPEQRVCQQMAPCFGSGKNDGLRERLAGDWLPCPVTRVEDGGVVYSQRTFVAPVDREPPAGSPAWLREHAVCVAEFTVENPQASEAATSLALRFSLDVKSQQKPTFTAVQEGLLAVNGDRVFALVETGDAMPLGVVNEPGVLSFSGKLPAGGKARIVVYLPAWKLPPANYAMLLGAARWSEALKTYWEDVLQSATRVEVPDTLLTHVIRASQVHCMLAARNEDRGRHIAAWVGADRYGPLESEAQAVLRGMDMMGCKEFARSGLDFFMKRFNDQGYLTTGYTMIGTGEVLWTVAEHQERHPDAVWLKGIVPRLLKACRWIAAQRAKTMGFDADGNKVPEYGLMPPGVSADWERYAYRFYNDAQYCRGLETIARKLADLGEPEAAALQDEARQYREDVLRAYRWAQVRCPVVPLSTGAWVPNHPAMLDVFGNVEDMVPGEDGNRSWCYSVEIGSHHLAATGLLDRNSTEVVPMMDYLEDQQFLRNGWGDYPEEKNRNDVFNLGGFSKVQPYYSRNAEIYAMRDDVKPFLRSYFNALSSLLNAENLSLWEHFHNGGGWNKTHETGWFLAQTATMLVTDHDGELWLAPMVTDRWLENGKKIDVQNIPTRFGPVSYTITSSSDAGHIDAVVDPPARDMPKRLVLRVRHPDGKSIHAVLVNGKAHADFDLARQCVILPPSKERLTVRIDYD